MVYSSYSTIAEGLNMLSSRLLDRGGDACPINVMAAEAGRGNAARH